MNGIKLQSRYQLTNWLSVSGDVRATIANNWIVRNKGYGIEAQFPEEVVNCYGNMIQENGLGPYSSAA